MRTLETSSHLFSNLCFFNYGNESPEKPLDRVEIAQLGGSGIHQLDCLAQKVNQFHLVSAGDQ